MRREHIKLEDFLKITEFLNDEELKVMFNGFNLDNWKEKDIIRAYGEDSWQTKYILERQEKFKQSLPKSLFIDFWLSIGQFSVISDWFLAVLGRFLVGFDIFFLF